MTYAIVKLGGKQYRVQEGEKLLVDRLAVDEDASFQPEVLFVGGEGQAELAPKGVEVTARVVGHVLGEKIRIGKYRRRTGYRRHTGFRARLSRIEIEAIGKKASRAAVRPRVKEKPAAEARAKPKSATRPKARSRAKAATPPPRGETKSKAVTKPKVATKQKTATKAATETKPKTRPRKPAEKKEA